MKAYLLLLLLAFALGLSAASQPLLKIDLDGRTAKISLRPLKSSPELKLYHPAWTGAELRTAYLAVESKTPLTESWHTFEFSFVPEQSGELLLRIRGCWTPKETVRWIAYDQFAMTGAKLVNPSFEEGTDGWTQHKSKWLLNRDDARDGRNFVECAHDFAMIQPIRVSAGIPVTVTFSAKAGAETPRPGATALRPKEHPANYYRYHDGKVRLLPLNDKGFSAPRIKPQAPQIAAGGPPPEACFAVPVSETVVRTPDVKIPVELLEENGVARRAPIRFGLPLPEKAAYHLNQLQVLAPDGSPVPAQFAVTAWWPDRSVKWALVQFDAPLKAHERAVYCVAFGKDVHPIRPDSPLRVEETPSQFTVHTGPLKATIDKQKFNLLKGVWLNGTYCGRFSAEGLTLLSEQGEIQAGSAAAPTRIFLEEQGAQTLTVRIDGGYGNGFPASYTVRLIFRAGSARVQAEITHINTNLASEFTDITGLRLQFLPAAAIRQWRTEQLGIAAPGRILQRDERTIQIGSRESAGRIGDAGTLETASGGLGVALRDAAFRYPKAFAVTAEALTIELLPVLPDAGFGKTLPHYLQFPFCEGKYRLKWGMSFTERLDFDFSGQLSRAELEAPEVIAVVDRDWVASTRTLPGVAPRNNRQFAAWDSAAISAFQQHMALKERQREYGFLNYGDWFGERGRNWGNNEYDLAHGLFMLFARTGCRDAFRQALLAARHQADVDIVHAYPDPYYLGANAQHSIGHTGISSGNAFPMWSSLYSPVSYAGINGHTWCDGMLDAWILAGDARVINSALLLGEHLTRYTAPQFRTLGTHERSGGWSLKALTALYQVTGESGYLDAAERIAAVIAEEQRFDKGGGWPHKMPKDHSGGHPDAFGNCPYLLGILTAGLRQYQLATNSPRSVNSLIAAADWQGRVWSEDAAGWPYAASWDGKPYFEPKPTLNLLIAPGLLAGGRLGARPEYGRIARRVLDLSTLQGLSPGGKELGIELCFIGELIEEMMGYEREHPEETPYRYDAAAVLRTAGRSATPHFRIRGPENKEFELILTRDGVTEVSLSRNRHGGRPKFNPECSFRIVNDAGAVVAAQTLPTTKEYRGSFRLEGKAGARFKLLISDDLTGVWSVAPGEGFRAFAILGLNSSIGNAGFARYYFTVPAGTETFSIALTGVHPGVFKGWAVAPDGSIGGQLAGCNNGQVARLPWLKEQSGEIPRQTMQIKRSASRDSELWTLIVYSSGDLEPVFQGIPGILSLTPEKYDL